MRILIATLFVLPFVLPFALPLTTSTAMAADGAILVLSATDGPMPMASSSTQSKVKKAVRTAPKK
jgi:hypothetical protein